MTIGANGFTQLSALFWVFFQVAEALINPFGEDDDDFDMNWLIDRNLQVSYLIVDEMHAEHPELVRDQYWDEQFPELPYTAAAEETRVDPVIGAAANYEVRVTTTTTTMFTLLMIPKSLLDLYSLVAAGGYLYIS